MIIVGCDFHPSWQQVAVVDTDTGKMTEHKLINGDSEASAILQTIACALACWN